MAVPDNLLSCACTAETIEKKLTEIRDKLLAHIEVNNHTPPKSLTGFTSVLKRCLPENEVVNSLELLKKYGLIEVNSKRQVSYNPILLTNIIH